MRFSLIRGWTPWTGAQGRVLLRHGFHAVGNEYHALVLPDRELFVVITPSLNFVKIGVGYAFVRRGHVTWFDPASPFELELAVVFQKFCPIDRLRP